MVRLVAGPLFCLPAVFYIGIVIKQVPGRAVPLGEQLRSSRKRFERRTVPSEVNDSPVAGEPRPNPAFMQCSGTLSNDGGYPAGVSRGQSAILPSFLCLPHAAVEMMRKARAMPRGSERRAARQLARALRDLAKTEAWLEGQTLRLRPVPSDRERARHPA